MAPSEQWIAERFRLGLDHHRAGRLPQAEAAYREILARDPGHADSLRLLGTLAQQVGRLDLAIEYFGEAARLRPAVADYGLDLGNALAAAGRFEEAEARLRETVRRAPASPEACNNLGGLLLRRSRFAEAEACFRAALRLRPDLAVLHANLADALLCLGRCTEAEAACAEALRLKPDYPEAHLHLARARLLAGRLEGGWPEFEWRWRMGHLPPRPFVQPQWTGEPGEGRTLLLHGDHGLGDSIQFGRYVPLAAARGWRVILEVPTPLARLMAGLQGAAAVIAHGEALPPFDRHLPLMSAARVFATGLATIPAEIPYLRAGLKDIVRWRDRLAPLPRPWIGLVWAGNPEVTADPRRSIPLERFAALAGAREMSLISLQKGQSASAALAPPGGLRIHDWTAELADFADTASLVAALDLVISVDTSVAHLAGALGKLVWLLNRFDTCWRWMLGRADSPWYPTMRIFRQPAPGDWDAVLRAVRTEIGKMGETGLPETDT